MHSRQSDNLTTGSKARAIAGAGIGRTSAALAFFATITIFLLAGCGDSKSPAASGGQPQPEPSGAPATSPNLTRELAVIVAEEAFKQDHSLATAVENPYDMVTRLMRFRELRRAESLPDYSDNRDRLVWIAQVEGTSRPVQKVENADGRPEIYRFNAVAIDAATGDVISRLQSEYEPFILPQAFLQKDVINVALDERDILRDSLPVSRDDAVEIVFSKYGNPVHRDRDAMETALVMYSAPVRPGGGSIGPEPTPTAAPTTTPATGPQASPTAVPTWRVRATSTPVVDRLSWLVTMPGRFGFDHCAIGGPPSEAHHTC